MENTIKDYQANEIMDTIAQSICAVLGTFADDDFIDENVKIITKVVNEKTRETFEEICSTLGITGVELDD